MNNFAINNLANMEFMLYGGRSGMNMNCPSMYNGYMGLNNNLTNYYNPMFRGYGNYNYNKDIFTQYNDGTKVNNPSQTAATGNSQVDWNNPQFKGLSDDINELGDYYVKNSAPSESLMGAAVGGAVFGLMNNPRMVVHPWNSIASTKAVDNMFKAIKEPTSELAKMWSSKEGIKLTIGGKEVVTNGYEVLSNAYSRMHKLEALHRSKLGLFRKSIKGTPEGEALYTKLKTMMETALKSGNAEEIAKATEVLKRETNAFTGHIPNLLRKMGLEKPLRAVRKFINPTHYEADIAKVAEKSLVEAGGKTTLKQALKHSCGVGNGLLFAGMEFLMDMGKIKTAFDKNSSTGWTQVGQTAIKGAGSAIGWAVGEGIGAWAGAKLGAMAGTAIAPGVGTAIGAIAGLVGGSIGCWLTGKITHKIVGKEAGTVAEVEKMKQTKEGQVQLLQLTAQQAQDDKNLSKRTFQALQNVGGYYGVNA